MPLSEEKRAELEAAAIEAGEDPDEVIAEAEAIAADDDDGPATTPAADEKKPAAEIRIFAYHMPFMKVKEIRSSIGLTEEIVEQDLPSGEWLAKHGGTAPAGPPAEGA